MLTMLTFAMLAQAAASGADLQHATTQNCSLPANTPPPPKGFVIDCPASHPWEKDPIIGTVDNTPKLGPGPYELVVHWPTAGAADYRRIYKTGRACLRARDAVLEPEIRNFTEVEAENRAAGYRKYVAAPGPDAMCIPID